jgi:alginate O-acetyltransferase complex protein AlgI
VVFSSSAFLFLFLPLFLLGYFLMPQKYRSGWILAGSWFYYGWWRVDFLLLLVATSIWAWFVGTRIVAARGDAQAGDAGAGAARNWKRIGVVVPLVILGYFKYFNFGIDTVSGISALFGGQSISAWHVILPVGISFYTFQIISYIVDVHRGTVPAGRSLVDVAAYVSLFPQLVAGPIVRYKEVAFQFQSREHGWDTFVPGVGRFMIGLARKVLIADSVAPLANAVFAASNPSLAAAWVGTLAYAIQIYFDFAAYSDMAIGLGRMLGFRLPENFNMPYRSGSITEFWRRWHMTLSAWLRDYLYIPLGGNRLGPGRTLVNLMTVMVLGGLWHGAAWSFVAWGAWHGIWLVGERLILRDKAPRMRSIPYRIVTLCAVLVSWVVFRADSLGRAGQILASMVGANGIAIEPSISWQFDIGGLVALAVGLLVCVFEPAILRFVSDLTDGQASHARPARITAGVVVSLLFILSVLRVLASSYSPFLYFRF